MPVRIVAESPAAPAKLADLSAALKAALTETRADDGCEEILPWLNAGRESWRVETGMLDLWDALLEGGRAGFVPRKLVPAGC